LIISPILSYRPRDAALLSPIKEKAALQGGFIVIRAKPDSALPP
jgi:hypothetical protein